MKLPHLLAVAAALTVAASTTATPAANAATHPHPCASARGKTLAATTETRVYRRPGDDSGTFACHLPNGRSVGLGDQNAYPDLTTIEHVRIAGRFVAYGLTVSARTGTAASVRVADVVKRRIVRQLAPVSGDDAGAVRDIVLHRSGAVAWLAATGGGAAQVWKADRAGTVNLAQGAIDPTSLALTAAGRLYWLQDGVAATATLAG